MYKYLIFSFLLLFFVSCDQENKEEEQIPQWTKEKSTHVNSQFAREEEIKIRLYIKRKEHADFKETGTGLRYWLYEDHEGPTVQSNQTVDVKFKMSLLDGTVLYKSDGKEVSTFRVDQDHVESGLMEGIKFMSEGDKAEFIIPSPLAHGLLGDRKEIPPLEVIVTDLELIKIH